MAVTTQTIRVDLSTGKVIPTAYTHQNDTARTLVFDMYNGGMPYTMTGNTVKFAYKSPIVNGQYSVIAGASMASGTVSGNKVSVTLPVAYTQISGVGMLTMIITPTSGTVRPVNIRLVVQKAADGADVVAGASDFPDAWMDEKVYSWLDDHIDGIFTEEQFNGAIDTWLDDHPEATTTVQDGSLTPVKLNSSLKNEVETVKVIFMPVAYYTNDSAAGDCTVFRSKLNNKTIMVDSGATHSYSLIKSELQSNGISHIDYFILSHYHADHYGNINSLIADGYIDSNTICYLPKSAGVTVSNWGDEESVRTALSICTIITPTSSTVLSVDDIDVTFFNCDDADIAYYDASTTLSGNPDCNNYSVCNYVTFGETRILMLADVMPYAQERIVLQGYVKQCDIVKLPHHAVNSSNYADLLITANAKTAVASVGAYSFEAGNAAQSKDIFLADGLGAECYLCGNGAVIFGLSKSAYSVFPNSDAVSPFPDYDNHYIDIYVDSTYSGEESIGTQDKPYKDIRAAVARASKLNVSAVHINVDSQYTCTEPVHVNSAFPRISIYGNGCSLYSLYVVDSSVNVNDVIIYGAINMALRYRNSKGILTNVTINGDIYATTQFLDGRGAVFYASECYLENCTISNKRIAIATYNASQVTVYGLKGTNNAFVAFANYGTFLTIYKDSTLAYTQSNPVYESHGILRGDFVGSDHPLVYLGNNTYTDANDATITGYSKYSNSMANRGGTATYGILVTLVADNYVFQMDINKLSDYYVRSATKANLSTTAWKQITIS